MPVLERVLTLPVSSQEQPHPLLEDVDKRIPQHFGLGHVHDRQLEVLVARRVPIDVVAVAVDLDDEPDNTRPR